VGNGVQLAVGPGVGVTAGVTERSALNHVSYAMHGKQLTVRFANVFSGSVNATVYNLQGRQVAHRGLKVVNGAAGAWNLSGLVTGNYLIRLEKDGRVVSSKISLR